MENQDKNIDKHFRKLAEEQQPKSFQNMDKIWDKIEQKLDRKPTKKVVPFWKYAGIAAALLVFVSLGIRFINQPETEEHLPVENEKRIVIDEKKAKDILDQQTETKEDVYAYEDVEDKVVESEKEQVFVQPEVKKDQEVVTMQEDFDDSTTSGRADKEVDYGDRGVLKSDGMQTGKAEESGRPEYQMDELVINSYRTVSRSRSEAAISTVTSKTIEGRPNVSIVQNLQGQVSGLNILTKKENKHTNIVSENSESYENFTENPFESAQTNPVSTFSIDVDNASYTNIRRFLNNGQTVPKDAVRIEEMINFFKYDYAQPKGKHPFAIHTEYSDAPWNPNHKLLKIGLKGKEIPTDKLPKSNFVFLVDVSGSMESPNKLPLLKSSMKVLLDKLRDDDRVSIVYYANGTGVLLEPTKASDKKKIVDAIDNMRAGGGTSGAAGLDLAYEMAEKHFIKNGNNRIILATDGDFNIGKSSDEEMQNLIEEKRKSGVFLTCLGFGMGNYKDSKLMTLSEKGNGN
ncbi:MAG TPA: von Willebrand factor type A domain-containing protein [Flavobacterium sp.]|nr:von Willebrand factor type A domain-containing protein [Flavobacterium sp.]